MISVTITELNPTPDEIVTFTGSADPIEDILINVLNAETGELLAVYTIYIKTLGINYRMLRPGLLSATVQTWTFTGKESGETASSVTINIQTEVPPDITIILSASKTDVEKEELITFQIATTPVATYTVTLEAYVSGIREGIWRVPIINGSGEKRLAAGQLGDIVQWKVIDDYDNESNLVTTTVGDTPPQPPTGEPKASIVAIRVQDLNRFLWYEVHPEGRQAYCDPGNDKLHVVFGVKNIGGADGNLRGRLINNAEVVIIPESLKWCAVGELVYWESDIDMPPEDYGFTAESGTDSLSVGRSFIVKTTVEAPPISLTKYWKEIALSASIVGGGIAGVAIIKGRPKEPDER